MGGRWPPGMGGGSAPPGMGGGPVSDEGMGGGRTGGTGGPTAEGEGVDDMEGDDGFGLEEGDDGGAGGRSMPGMGGGVGGGIGGCTALLWKSRSACCKNVAKSPPSKLNGCRMLLLRGWRMPIPSGSGILI